MMPIADLSGQRAVRPQERMNSPLQGRKVRLRGLERPGDMRRSTHLRVRDRETGGSLSPPRPHRRPITTSAPPADRRRGASSSIHPDLRSPRRNQARLPNPQKQWVWTTTVILRKAPTPSRREHAAACAPTEESLSGTGGASRVETQRSRRDGAPLQQILRSAQRPRASGQDGGAPPSE